MEDDVIDDNLIDDISNECSNTKEEMINEIDDIFLDDIFSDIQEDDDTEFYFLSKEEYITFLSLLDDCKLNGEQK